MVDASKTLMAIEERNKWMKREDEILSKLEKIRQEKKELQRKAKELKKNIKEIENAIRYAKKDELDKSRLPEGMDEHIIR